MSLDDLLRREIIPVPDAKPVSAYECSTLEMMSIALQGAKMEGHTCTSVDMPLSRRIGFLDHDARAFFWIQFRNLRAAAGIPAMFKTPAARIILFGHARPDAPEVKAVRAWSDAQVAITASTLRSELARTKLPEWMRDSLCREAEKAGLTFPG